MGSQLSIVTRVNGTFFKDSLFHPPSFARFLVKDKEGWTMWAEVCFKTGFAGKDHLFVVGTITAPCCNRDDRAVFETGAVVIVPVPYSTEGTWDNPTMFVLSMDHEKEEFRFKNELQTLEGLLK